MAVAAGRAWVGVGVLLVASPSTGCVERLIRDDDGVAEGGGGELDTDSDGLGDTEQLPTDGDEPEPEPDPDAECTIPQDCADGQTCFEGVCVGSGTVRVSLSWSVVTDLDLHVGLPDGSWIDYQNPITTYGELDVDDCIAAMCENPSGTHVENVFLEGHAPRGRYRVRVINFDGRLPADYQIQVAGETSATFLGTLPAQMFVEGPIHEFDW